MIVWHSVTIACDRKGCGNEATLEFERSPLPSQLEKAMNAQGWGVEFKAGIIRLWCRTCRVRSMGGA